MIKRLEIVKRVLGGDTNIVELLSTENKARLFLYFADENTKKNIEKITDFNVLSVNNNHRILMLTLDIVRTMNQCALDANNMKDVIRFVKEDYKAEKDIEEYLNYVVPKVNKNIAKLMLPLFIG